ncbi:Multidrug resistance-associated ABC transporter protein [Mycena sanguinolenta]|uniref:Multidrug resistance-associated ABC transporter protein n=1 Tax=Mycena sanguinolenta TaxID=230812 RepID=A0A8H6XXX4_9AGAR|nr:Multidrug resistance-associated ABC transporter protein [Mycena sanguinolenta]
MSQWYTCFSAVNVSTTSSLPLAEDIHWRYNSYSTLRFMDLDFTSLLQSIMNSVSHGPELWPLFIPACVTAISASSLLIHFAFAINSTQAQIPSPGISRGAIHWLRVARTLGCLGLLGLSIFPFNDGLVRGVLRVTPYLYASVLACLSLNPSKAHHRLVRHANCILFCVFCVYVYRDLIPLATFTEIPADIEGCKLWAKIGLLFATAVVVPLLMPRQYIPVDPLNPQTVLNPEQTASIFSFTFYSFLDHIIFLAHRKSQLEEEELYPLCDTDAAAHLQKRSFKYLDTFSGNSRHIAFGLLRIFHREFAILALLLILRVLTNYSGPYAMNQLLQYIETRDDPDARVVVRPWVWIGLIFLGPVVGSFAFQTYAFINTRTLVQVEAIITQLVFTHSLRIRMKAETTDTKDNAPAVEAALSPSPSTSPSGPGPGSDTESTVETATQPEYADSSSHTEDNSASPTMQASSSSIKPTWTASKLHPKPAAKEPKILEEKKKSGGNLAGKINNLVTVDLGNITDSRHFLITAFCRQYPRGVQAGGLQK